MLCEAEHFRRSYFDNVRARFSDFGFRDPFWLRRPSFSPPSRWQQSRPQKRGGRQGPGEGPPRPPRNKKGTQQRRKDETTPPFFHPQFVRSRSKMSLGGDAGAGAEERGRGRIGGDVKTGATAWSGRGTPVSLPLPFLPRDWHRSAKVLLAETARRPVCCREAGKCGGMGRSDSLGLAEKNGTLRYVLG